jgi:hypothetical protein
VADLPDRAVQPTNPERMWNEALAHVEGEQEPLRAALQRILHAAKTWLDSTDRDARSTVDLIEYEARSVLDAVATDTSEEPER